MNNPLDIIGLVIAFVIIGFLSIFTYLLGRELSEKGWNWIAVTTGILMIFIAGYDSSGSTEFLNIFRVFFWILPLGGAFLVGSIVGHYKRKIH